MFCTNCGKEIPENAKFCNHCGAQQGSAGAAASRSTQQGGAAASAPSRSTQQQAYNQYASSQQPPQQNYASQQNYTSQRPAAKQKPGKGSKVGGIILLILGVVSVIGACANGTYQYMQYSFDLSDMIVILMQIGFIAGGIMMIAKSKGNGR